MTQKEQNSSLDEKNDPIVENLRAESAERHARESVMS